MKLIKVGAAVLNQIPMDWSGNRDRILAAIDSARRQQASLVCLPELCITGYGCEDAFHSPAVAREAIGVLQELLPATAGMAVSLGLPLLHGGAMFNAAALAVDGELAGLVCKQNLAGEGIHYEPRWFKAWPNDARSETVIQGNRYPIGDLIFDVGGVAIGFEICEDAWVASRPGGELAQRGVDVIMNPSASHFAFDKHIVRQRFVLEGSRAFHTGYIYANLLGNEAGRAIYDGDAMIASAGRMLATGPRFSFADQHVTTAVLDVEETRMSRARSSSFRPLIDEDGRRVSVDFDFPHREPERAIRIAPDWESSDSLKEEEFTRAVSLGLFDYLRKSWSRGFVISLSGGADSAAVAVLCGLAIHLAAADIGWEEVARKLHYIPDLGDSPQEAIQRLLSCVYQATRNSGEVTRNAAVAVAHAVGAEFLELDVDHLVETYVEVVEGGIQRELTWETDDIALQNIQARARGPSVWLLANIRSALLLATSNRSEAAVGYSTMDGDTCGGLSPIAGIDKAFLRHWLRWMEREGPADGEPVPALKAVNDQQPTAELRPPSESQTDEGDLMPYPLLDAIERAAIRDKHSPEECYREMRSEFPETPPFQLGPWVERFFRLWCRNQWKRERYAPSFHLDDENLDPKTWCRFPILSGGFQRELGHLRKIWEAESTQDKANVEANDK